MMRVRMQIRKQPANPDSPLTHIDIKQSHRRILRINLFTAIRQVGKDIISVLECPSAISSSCTASLDLIWGSHLKYSVSVADNLEYAQCELLVDKQAEGKYLKLYPAEFSYRLNEIMLNISTKFILNLADTSDRNSRENFLQFG